MHVTDGRYVRLSLIRYAETRVRKEGAINFARPLFLGEWDEALGKFSGSRQLKDHVLVLIEDSRSISLPVSASRMLYGIKVGDCVSIIRTNNDENPIRVRRIP